MGLNGLGAITAGLGGVGQGINNMLGLSDTPPEQRINSLLNKLNYPIQTQGGQVATDLVTKPFQMLAEIGK